MAKNQPKQTTQDWIKANLPGGQNFKPGGATPIPGGVSLAGLLALMGTGGAGGLADVLGGGLVKAGEAGVPGATRAGAALGSKAGKAVAGGVGLAALSKLAGSGKKNVNPGQSGKAKTTAAKPTATAGVQNPAAMQLFWNQIVAPYMANIQKQMQTTQQQYGNYMGGLIGQGGQPGTGPGAVQLNPAVRSALQAMVPGQQEIMGLTGQGAAATAASGPFLDQLTQMIQNTQAAQQQATGEYEKQYGVGLASAQGLLGAVPGLQGLTAGAPTQLGQQQQPGLAAQINPMQQALVAQSIARGGG